MYNLLRAIRDSKGIFNKGFTFVSDHFNSTFLSYHDIYLESRKRALYLRSLGLGASDLIALILSNDKDLVLWFLGAIMGGVTVVPIYPPSSSDISDRYSHRVLTVLTLCHARKVVVSPPLLPALEELLLRVPELEHCISSNAANDFVDYNTLETDIDITPPEVCFIQFTSDHTADSSGVIFTHNDIADNAVRMERDLPPSIYNDVTVYSPLLYRDMGLLFILMPLMFHTDAFFVSTTDLVMEDREWTELS